MQNNQQIYRGPMPNNQQIYRGTSQQIYRSPSQVRQPNSRTYQQSYTNRYSAPQLNSPSRTVNPYNPYSRTGQTSSSLIYQRQLPQQTQKYQAPVYQYQRQGTNPQSMQATLKQQALADHDTLVRINGGWREHPLPVSTQKMLEHLPTAERNHIQASVNQYCDNQIHDEHEQAKKQECRANGIKHSAAHAYGVSQARKDLKILSNISKKRISTACLTCTPC